MAEPQIILVDSGFLITFYSVNDRYHTQVKQFLSNSTSYLVTTLACITEVIWLLAPDWRVQNEFLSDLAKRLYEWEQLLPQDFQRIAELNAQYFD